MNNMLHMKLVWREVKSNLGYVIETAAGMGGPLFHICRVGSCLCNDDDGHNTAIAIVEEHNAALKRKLRESYQERWANDLPENISFYVTKTAFTLGYAPPGESTSPTPQSFSSGELLAHESSVRLDEDTYAYFVNLKGERGFLKNVSLLNLIGDGIIADI